MHRLTVFNLNIKKCVEKSKKRVIQVIVPLKLSLSFVDSNIFIFENFKKNSRTSECAINAESTIPQL